MNPKAKAPLPRFRSCIGHRGQGRTLLDPYELIDLRFTWNSREVIFWHIASLMVPGTARGGEEMAKESNEIGDAMLLIRDNRKSEGGGIMPVGCKMLSANRGCSSGIRL